MHKTLMLLACLLALALPAPASAQGERVTGIGPYRFEMSPDQLREEMPRARFFERFFDLDRYPALRGSGTLTMGPPHDIRERNFAVIAKFNHERRLFKISLVHFDWARSREECYQRHLDILADFTVRHGAFAAAEAMPGMQRIIEGEVSGVYVGIAPEDARDSVIQPETRTLSDGSSVLHYRATLEAADLREVESDWRADQNFLSIFEESEAPDARYIELSTSVRPLSADDEPNGPYRFNCTTSIAIADPSIESRVR